MQKKPTGGLVYSTDSGRMCPACRQPQAQCTCKQLAARRPKGDGVVRISLDTKGRGGKAVTVVRGIALDTDALATLGKRLRSACGTGGTVKDGVIEVQGDHLARVTDSLVNEGWRVKRSGS